MGASTTVKGFLRMPPKAGFRRLEKYIILSALLDELDFFLGIFSPLVPRHLALKFLEG
jgi:hypothetical protein